MRYAVIEGTGIRVSRISFGTASLHHLFSRGERQRVLRAAAAHGISHFDTSPLYGFGLAETELGTLVSKDRAKFSISTKVGLYPVGGASQGAVAVWTRKLFGKVYPPLAAPVVDWRVTHAANSLNASLRRLKTDYVDFLLLHEPDMGLIDKEAFLGWLEREKRAGKVRYWGLAGLPHLLEPWVSLAHPLGNVLQMMDDLSRKTPKFLTESGRDFQFTYGYLSSQGTESHGLPAKVVIRRALEKNGCGSVIVSTRKVERVRELAEAVG